MRLRRLPAVLARIGRLAWRADRPAVITLLVAWTAAAVAAAVALAVITAVLTAVIAASTAYGRHEPAAPLLHPALIPAAAVTVVLAAAALGDTVARAAAARLGPQVARDADLAVLDAAAAVELVDYEHPGCEDQLDAAGKGAVAARDLVEDLQSAIAVIAQLAAVTTVVAVLNFLLTVLVLFTAAPRAYASLRASRLEHAAATAARSDSRLRSTLRVYSCDRHTAAEIRVAGMARFLRTRYRQVSGRLEAVALTAVVRGLRVQLTGDAVSALVLCGAFAPSLRSRPRCARRARHRRTPQPRCGRHRRVRAAFRRRPDHPHAYRRPRPAYRRPRPAYRAVRRRLGPLPRRRRPAPHPPWHPPPCPAAGRPSSVRAPSPSPTPAATDRP